MKNFITLFAALSCCLPLAAASIPLEQALELCRAEQNALRRLNCYDTIATATEPTSATTVEAKPAPATAAVNETQTQDSFGIEHRQTSNADSAEKVYLTVKKLKFSPHKEMIVEFENGQIWRQSGTDHYKIAVGERHYVKRGVLNSFFLGNDNSNRAIRVRREK
jgi:hypothetical protein